MVTLMPSISSQRFVFNFADALGFRRAIGRRYLCNAFKVFNAACTFSGVCVGKIATYSVVHRLSVMARQGLVKKRSATYLCTLQMMRA
jgi:hypothetical protein